MIILIERGREYKYIFMDIKNNKHKKYVELANKGIKNTEICKELHIAGSTGYQIRAKYKEYIGMMKPINNTTDITKYEDTLHDNLKYLILRYTNELKHKDIKKASHSQIATTIGILFDKLRLHEGKSTSNVLHKHIEDMTDEEQKKLREIAKLYKESMLS